MKARFLKLNEAGPNPRFDSWVMVGDFSDFSADYASVILQRILHNGHKSLYTSHLRGKKNGLCQGTTHKKMHKTTALGGGKDTILNIDLGKYK